MNQNDGSWLGCLEEDKVHCIGCHIESCVCENLMEWWERDVCWAAVWSREYGGSKIERDNMTLLEHRRVVSVPLIRRGDEEVVVSSFRSNCGR